MSILNTIVEKKKERLFLLKNKTSLSELKSLINDVDKPRDFQKNIKRDSDNIKLIAEVKKASPSKGLIRQKFDHIAIAGTYQEKSVHAISVLTEEDFFMGKMSFLSDIKRVTTKPLLRKDFIFDEYQIYESRAYEADAILLIAAVLERNQAAEYLHLARELGLSVLFEVHNFGELEMAMMVDSNIIGINNRDLTTLKIDMNTSLALKNEIPADKLVISESGIRTREDVQKLENAGFDAMLIGTTFMEAEDIGGKIDELMIKPDKM
jgi:indole-3-glycerol phosphate synthase